LKYQQKIKSIYIVVNADWFLLSHRLPIAVAAKRDEYSVTIVANDTGKSEEIRKRGFGFIDLPVERSSQNIFKEIKILFFLFQIYRRQKPSIVHHVALKAVTYGAICSRILRIPTVNALSGMGYTFTEKGRSTFLQKFLLYFLKYGLNGKKSFLILQNLDDKNEFIQKNLIQKEKLKIIRGSGVDCNVYKYFEEPKRDSLQIVFPARLLKDKGIIEFVDAARIIKSRGYENIRFILSGDLDEGNPTCIEEEILLGWVSDNIVEWPGFQNNMIKVFEDSNIVVLPSYREGLPKALIEAAAIGRAIITTDVPGCREVVSDNENGFLVPAKNSLALADKIEILIKDPKLRSSMGKKSREKAEKEFSIEDVVDKTLSIYSELLR